LFVMKIHKLKPQTFEKIDYTLLILRLGLGLVFIYFAFDKFFNVQGYIATFKTLGVPEMFASSFYVIAFGAIEFIIALNLLAGWQTKLVSFAATLVILAIVLTFWLRTGEILVRDIGLITMALALILLGPGRFSIKRFLSQ